MIRRTTGLLALAAFALLSLACDQTANTNANANVNANSNLNANRATPAANANANTNANTTTGRAPTREEYERDRDRYAREARESGRTVGSGANDGWLWVKTRFELATADDLRDSTINVDVDNGVVTLSGTVATQAQKTRAQTVARAVEGVTNVRNNLTVSSGNANANGNRNANGNSNR
ncbi:MAG TPA: BON domain-containing protein [Pyrinomonadaceae bacterium]|nr:BON domain-containing protein [Pyrinomonadaceae bacterium]